jgi:cytochrome c-type biogenesis protein CcmH/NrfF
MWRKSALSLLALALTATSLTAQTRPGAGPSARDSALSRQLKARPGDSLGRLEVPEAAGRGVAAVTARDNSALVRALEEKIRCTCGCNLSVYTCRTTDFTCTTSPAMHQLVLARLDSGMTEAQILDAFQRQYGEMIFMSPPRHGFNLVMYLMPLVGLGVGLGLVVGVVKRWGKVAARDRVERAAAPEDLATPEELEKLKHELEHFEA